MRALYFIPLLGTKIYGVGGFSVNINNTFCFSEVVQTIFYISLKLKFVALSCKSRFLAKILDIKYCQPEIFWFCGLHLVPSKWSKNHLLPTIENYDRMAFTNFFLVEKKLPTVA